MALVRRSWCYPAQVELFGTVILKCPVRAQLFVEAFVRNIGPASPHWRMGVDRLHLETFVRHIYVDIPENYSQKSFYGNLSTILPLLTNLRSLYVVMRRWNSHIWEIELGRFLPEHAPPSLERLSVQVSKWCQFRIILHSCSYHRFQQAIRMLYCSRGQTTNGGRHGLARGRTSRL
jgi:hypothetical protein